jgi:hypothetical protein
MIFTSALENLLTRTVGPIPGSLGKLEYLTALRDPNGKFDHWGLTRTYGEQEARESLQEAHLQLFTTILRMPLRKLVQDVEISKESVGLSHAEYLAKLQSSLPRLLPDGTQDHSTVHFKFALEAASRLLEASSDCH